MKSPVALAAAFAVAATAARAATTDLVVHCDPPLADVMRAVAAAFLAGTGVRPRIFPTAPNAIVAQLAREIQNDIVVTQPEILARIGAAGQLADIPPSARWRNRLIIAARRGEPHAPIDRAVLAAPDPGWGGGPDGPTLLSVAGLKPGRFLGAFNTEEARTLVLSGEAAYAMIHRTELTADLERIAVPGLTAERIAVAAITTSTRRPNPGSLLRFLATREAAAILNGAGLEAMS